MRMRLVTAIYQKIIIYEWTSFILIHLLLNHFHSPEVEETPEDRQEDCCLEEVVWPDYTDYTDYRGAEDKSSDWLQLRGTRQESQGWETAVKTLLISFSAATWTSTGIYQW